MPNVSPIDRELVIDDRFRIISELGSGGMGVVYRAWDMARDVPVVLKMPKENLVGNKDFLSRFSREIRAMSALVHSHIVPIIADGEAADGRPYVAMRFLPGGSLSDRRLRDDAKQPLKNSPATLHLWLPAVAAALDYVHSNGVVHRDVKPDNVFFDAFWSAYVGDFGIAKVVGESELMQKEETLTGTAMTIGTPAYMAPELFSSKAKIDGKVDQYALGIMVYEMLAAVRPFTGETAHFVIEHVALPPPPLSSHCDGLPKSLCDAVHRSLSKKPAERFNSCGEFVTAVLCDVPRRDLESGTVRLLCPSCSTILKLPLTAGGRQGKCPKCQTVMNVAKDLGALWLETESLGRGVGLGFKPISTLTPISKVTSGVGGIVKGARVAGVDPRILWGGIVAAVLGVLLLFYVVSSSGASKRAAEREAAATRQHEVEEHATVVVENTQLKAEKRAAEKAAEDVARAEKAAAEKAAEAMASAEQTAIKLTDALGMEFIKIPKGAFQMGSPAGDVGRGPDETPVEVSFSEDFDLCKTEVTQGQWQAVMGTEPWKVVKEGGKIGKDRAATYVSWEDATAFCQRLTDTDHTNGKLPAGELYRLPTEAEWEYACRAGTKTTYSFGNDEKKLGEYAWFSGNTAGEQYAHAVGLKKPNPWGLHDMHGNVWEWCSDWYDGTLPGGADPAGPRGGSSRVVRGGGWRYLPGRCRSAARHYVPSARIDDLGFRVARSQSATGAERRQQGVQAEPAPQVAAAERPAQLEENVIGMKLVVVPAGKFTMGEGGGAVAVTLTKPFLIGTTEVTQGQFKKVMGTEPWKGQQFVQIGEDNAASYVDWNDATAFCQRLTDTDHKKGKLPVGESYRLPTDTEWEYACRAGTQTTYSFGDDESQLGNYGWFDGNTKNVGQGYAHKVGMKKPNPLGLFDMHGNVHEWCSDWYGGTLPGGTDPVGSEGGSNRLFRGGNWLDAQGDCRSAYRNGIGPSFRNYSVGFRVARNQSAAGAERRQQVAQSEPAPQVAAAERAVQLEANSIGIELIEIPAGKFMMGEGVGVVRVTLTRPFLLGTTEVTQEQYEKVMGTKPWAGKFGIQVGKDNPATHVSWNDATEFCQKLTKREQNPFSTYNLKAGEVYRLPTEAEWEYACRAGTTTAYSFGDDASQFGKYGWFSGNTAGEQYAHRVGSKKPNPWGLYDMHGNVWDWCSDWYGGTLPGGKDPVGPKGGSVRVLRGGCWADDSVICRLAFRGSREPSYSSYYLGFRVARNQSAAGAERRQQVAQSEPAPQVAAAERAVQLEANSIGIELIEIPAGKFTMGEGVGVVRVTLTRPFLLGTTEVTQEQYEKVMGTKPWAGESNVQIGKDNRAKHDVSWNNAREFCQKLTKREQDPASTYKLKAGEVYRLPTEAEWEYACRAGTTTAYSFGDDASQFGEYGWFSGNTAGEQYAHRVGLKRPNPFGLFDMHGNVHEWCSDWYGGTLLGGTDPVGPASGLHRVYRGGSFMNAPDIWRSASRILAAPSDHNLGFRVARSQSAAGAERRQQVVQAETAPQVAAAERPVQLEVNSIGIELIEIPAGKFTMGEGAGAVPVTLTRPFLLGTTEVTQEQYQKVMGKKPWAGEVDVQVGKDYPATSVSWDDAKEFCQKLTKREKDPASTYKLKAGEVYRLPTEAEWEYACRAGTTTAYSFGDDTSQFGEYGWFRGNTAGEQYAHRVGLKKPNPWGLYDMHGNVWEWCSDWYDSTLPGGTDPVGPEGGFDRVYRGGSWWYISTTAGRRSATPASRRTATTSLGFRVARGSAEAVDAAPD